MGDLTNHSYAAALKEKIIACGLSSEQAEHYVKFDATFHWDYSTQQPVEAELPSDDCFQTLAAAQQIRKDARWELDDYQIRLFLQVPFSGCLAAKEAIAECFGKTAEDVDNLYAKDDDWLFVTRAEVIALAEYLKAEFSDAQVRWQIYCRAGLLGINDTRRRVDSLCRMLGQEMAGRIIAADAARDVWIFYRFYSDPVGGIRYMLEYGLTPETILSVIESGSIILYLYKEDRRRSYNHDQEYLDFLLRNYREGNFHPGKFTRNR